LGRRGGVHAGVLPFDADGAVVADGREGRVPQAIFAASDHTALGLIRAFAENGVRVPDDAVSLASTILKVQTISCHR